MQPQKQNDYQLRPKNQTESVASIPYVTNVRTIDQITHSNYRLHTQLQSSIASNSI